MKSDRQELFAIFINKYARHGFFVHISLKNIDNQENFVVEFKMFASRAASVRPEGRPTLKRLEPSLRSGRMPGHL